MNKLEGLDLKLAAMRQWLEQHPDDGKRKIVDINKAREQMMGEDGQQRADAHENLSTVVEENN